MTEIELTNIEDGTFLFDGAGKLTFCSDFCDKVLPGLTARLASDSDMEDVYMAIIALGFKASFPASDRDQLAAGWAIFKSVPGNIDFTSESGQVLRWSARRYGEDEIFAVLSDNTLNSRRVAQAAQLTKMSSISDMSGQIGHDLNNFLTIIQGNLELLETFVAEDEKLSRWVSAATLATERGTNMAKSLLYLGRRRPARRRDVVTGEAIQDTIAKMQDQLACPVQIEVLLSSDLSDVRVDETHFKIVLSHLIQNAIEACAEGDSILIRAENFIANDTAIKEQANALADFETADEESFVRITLSDTGRGMPVEISERVFEPYFTTKKDQKGAGLGLSTAYGFARQSGGNLSLVSTLGQGTSVVLEVPVGSRKVTLSPILQGDFDVALTGEERIMVVEDDTAVRTIASEMLSSLGYHITQATDATDALALITDGDPIDLIFSDVIMPGGIDGIQLARIIRDRYPQIKILLASGYANSERLSGVDEFNYLAKPYDQKILAQHLRRLLDS